MQTRPPLSTLRLILWPMLLTAAVSVARLLTERFGVVTTRSGGAFAWLGITWLGFVFGAWFAIRLRRAGSSPRVRAPWAWTTLALLAIAAVAAWQFRPLFDADRSEATFARVRSAVLVIVAVTVPVSLTMFALWPRLAWTLLCYAIPARLTVLALTVLAKVLEWDTHYTKFGPPGIERDLPGTIVAATIAQSGFWVPFTIVSGTFAGMWFATRRG